MDTKPLLMPYGSTKKEKVQRFGRGWIAHGLRKHVQQCLFEQLRRGYGVARTYDAKSL
jgi:hypothetical protein